MAFNLLGMQSPYSPEVTQLLGIDPREMRRQALWNGLAQAGAGLAATGNLGGALLGLNRGVNQGREMYMDDVMMNYRLQQDAAEREAARREQEAQAAFLANPSADTYRSAYPDQWAKQYAETELFPQPQQVDAPKSYAPIPYDMGDGQIGYGIPMEDGSFRPVQTPEGAQFLSPYDKAYQTNAGGVRGKVETEQSLSAPSDLQAADQALDLIRQIKTDPGLDWGTGIWSLGNVIPGTSGYDFQNLVDQTKSGAFLTAIDQLRGMGALSNMEGQAATSAVTRLNTATSKPAFLKALADYEGIVNIGRQRALMRGGGAAPQGGLVDPPAQGGGEEWSIDANGNPVRVR